ncbi:uncharacterized protein MONOS_9026 [Monocercomonoides exilis]|uniref:uncharacterized protein n=1 Tax=Monocercomonoides exilis TaxID=2049356 RepID=UPI00355A7E8D|nr:hypothetical protein MONOS_9026 [Monocercomonoides exilis]|eukprot:MONOS_9026.1-p1 / transcript=MONOS_9026.1 / gene=MONOS_9026 / organism=Monocercomonoides_exilis_PA203 / gene_product=unspecified product / transcript_product=unspecified product / location=Mono_scaffold00358:41344-41709(+) / protein_length=122 / sequence_SO=supercontig / SO=protein_coding / is_pseudo=false
MMLHGRNENEMKIGTLQEMEKIGAQVLFCVANIVLHSFEEEEVQLLSLANLDPHIVLFSEHMDKAAAYRSECSSASDISCASSDSSIVSSTSDRSSMNKKGKGSPTSSSLFEDKDNIIRSS